MSTVVINNYDALYGDTSGEPVTQYVSDTSYDDNWNGVANQAPSKNAVYDRVENLQTNIATYLQFVAKNYGAL